MLFLRRSLFVFGLLIFLMAHLVSAQESFPIQLGSKKISFAVFEKDYRLLLESDSIKADNKQKFLADYLDYQLKILAAEDEKIPSSVAFQEEYQSFRKELASPYLLDNEKVDFLVREAYQRLKFEKQVAHILVKIPVNPSASDTLLAYQKIQNIQKRLELGDDFSTLAKKFSEDDLSAQKGGLLGYITSLQTQYAFENAVYLLEKGQYSKIVRTGTGYHLIKILEIRPNQGKIRLAHILISVPVHATTNLQVDAKNKIDQVQKYLAKGDDSFELICKNYSEDPYSKGRGGELRRWYYASDLSEELQDKLFGIQRLGDFSDPIRTNLGWQIFKLLDKKPLLSYEEMAEYLRQKVLSDPERGVIIRSSFMRRVRSENKVLIQEDNKKTALERYAQDRVGDELYLNLPIFSIAGKSFTIKEFYTFIVEQQRKKVKSLGYLPAISESYWFDEFIDLNTLQVEEQHLEIKYPAFKEQMLEFYEGSLFSKMNEREIFDKSLDSLRQQNYFNSHSSQFTLPASIQAKLITSDTQKTLNDALDLLKSAPYPMNKRYPDISFGLNQNNIPENANKILQDLFLMMAKNRDYVVEISGHHDATEPDSLSQARVNKVVHFLSKKGIGVTQLIEKIEGMNRPSSKTDKSKNARVSFKFLSQSMEDVVKRFNAIKPNSLDAKEGLFNKGENAILDSIPWEISKRNFETKGRYAYLDIKKIDQVRLNSFEEARSTVIRALQLELDTIWLQNLKQKYPIILNNDVLNKIMQ